MGVIDGRDDDLLEGTCEIVGATEGDEDQNEVIGLQMRFAEE